MNFTEECLKIRLYEGLYEVRRGVRNDKTI